MEVICAVLIVAILILLRINYKQYSKLVSLTSAFDDRTEGFRQALIDKDAAERFGDRMRAEIKSLKKENALMKQAIVAVGEQISDVRAKIFVDK